MVQKSGALEGLSATGFARRMGLIGLRQFAVAQTFVCATLRALAVLSATG
jgi:hypothetical protein